MELHQIGGDPQSLMLQAIGRLSKDAKQDSYRTDPVGWLRDVLGIHAWSKQRDICHSVRDHKRTVVASCHSSGKSCISAGLACWWVAVHPPGSAIVVTTAPTYRQVNAILWEEIRKNHQTAELRGFPLPGHVTGADQWKLDNGRLVGFGRKPKDGDAHAFQGIHRRYVLVVIDEAAGVPEELWTGVEAITTTANSRILAIGNPDDRQTTFGDVYEEERYAELWNRIRIPASSTPNFTGERVPDPLPDVLVQRSWVEDRRTAWGEDDARYQSKVEAKFPSGSAMGLFTEPVLAQAFIEEDERVESEGALKIGVDVARFGDDKSVVAARRGKKVWIDDSWSGMDTVTSADQVYDRAYAMARKDAKGKVIETVDIRIDAIGVGAGVVDALAARRAKMMALDGTCWFEVREMHGSARVPEEFGGSTHGYGNARAWWHDQLKHQMRNGQVRVEQHDQLRDELRQIRMRYSSGKMYIVSKEEMRREGKKSPDFSDAVVYACAPVHEGLMEGDMFTESTEQTVEELRMQMAQDVYEQMAGMISPL